MFFISDADLLSKKYSTEPDGDVNDLSEGLTAFPPLSDEITEHTPTTSSKQKANHKYMELVGRRRSSASLAKVCDATTKGRQWAHFVFVKRLEKRDALDMPDNAGNVATREDQKKAKSSGKALLFNQDDDIEDDDEDYAMSENRNRINWENYQNEDGASVMELVALNARHEKYMREKGRYYY